MLPQELAQERPEVEDVARGADADPESVVPGLALGCPAGAVPVQDLRPGVVPRPELELAGDADGPFEGGVEAGGGRGGGLGPGQGRGEEEGEGSQEPGAQGTDSPPEVHDLESLRLV